MTSEDDERKVLRLSRMRVWKMKNLGRLERGETHHCRTCSVLLAADNWPRSRQTRLERVCSACKGRKERRREDSSWEHQCRRGFLTRRAKAKRNGIPFTLRYEDIVWPTHCPVLGIELVFGGGDTWNSPSFDRLDPLLGYVPGNVIVVSMRANAIKSNVGWRDIEKVAHFYRDLEQPRT